MTSLVLKTGYRGSDTYTLERRLVLQDAGRKRLTFLICDDFGGLYGFPHLNLAEWHWRDMGIRSLAQQEAA